MRFRCLLIPLLAALGVLGAGCGEDAATSPTAADAPLATGEWIDAALVGSQRPCASDDECASGVCRFDSCVGALAADQYWVQEVVARRIGARVAASPELGARVVETVERLLQREAGGPIVRARALFVLSFVPGAEATAALAAGLDDPSERVRRQAALALVSRGDDRGVELVIEELHAPETVRRAEAARALGGLTGERIADALTGVLEDDSRHVRRNALLSLGRVGDRRALRPLVTALRDGPASERYVVMRALRAVTGADYGLDPDAWQRLLQRETESREAAEPVKTAPPVQPAPNRSVPERSASDGSP